MGTEVTVTHKMCAQCLEDKLSSEFSKNPYVKSGLQSYCKKCVAANHRKRYGGIKSGTLIKATCPTCHSEFTYISSTKPRKYCSQKCRILA